MAMTLVEVILISVTCPECGMQFGMPQEYKANKVKDHSSFYCPNGHKQYFGENATERRLREMQGELDAERKNSQWWHLEAERTQRSLSATRGVLTRTKNRIAKGICPCCHRQFVNLHRHMEGQHPDYAGDNE